MAYLTLPQVQDIVRRKRRRDMGTPNSPMDIFEGDFSVVDDPYLQGIDQAGLLNMTSVEEVPAFDTNKWGDFTWGGGNNRIRILPEDRVGLDPINRRRGLLTPEQYEDVMAHEVGHSGEQAIGNYATWNPGVENRTHNMLYGHNIAGYFPTEQPSTLQTDAHSGVMSPYMGPGSRSWVDVDPVAAQERLLGVNQKARSMIDQGLLGQDTDSYGTEAFIPAPLRKFGSKAIKHLGGHDHDEPHDEPVAEPTSIKEAQAQGKSYFMKDGKKQLAVTGEQLAKFKKSDLYDSGSKKSALSQWANIANKKGGMKKLFPEEKKELKPTTPKADQKAASETAFNKIAEWEGGYQPSTFDDPGDKSNRIGYGRIAKKGEVTTKAKEDKWLKGEIDSIGKYLDEVVTADLTPNQRAALTSLVFNVGRSSFKGSKALAALNAGDMDEFRKQAFSKEKGWVKSGGKRMAGLVNRRKKEEDLFFG
jgi:GH24 family phage-related lysozyme (muramidase)